MRLFITGAFGNIGRNTVEALLAMPERHEVRVLRYRHEAPELARAWRGRVQEVDGDLRSPETFAAALEGVDVVVHLAFVIPPEALEDPIAAEDVNLNGTRRLLELTVADAPTAKFLFASSLDVYGHTGHLPPPRRIDDPLSPTDPYTQHKITCEGLVRSSGLQWGILRFADVPPMMLREPVPIMFEIPLAQRIHALHPLDAGLATAKAATSAVTWNRVWHIGGDASCQLTYAQYLERLLGAMGMGGALPAEAFTTKPYCTDWLDTDESQRVFDYQRHGFQDIVDDLSKLLGWRRPFTGLARPFVRRRMLSLSKYWKEQAR